MKKFVFLCLILIGCGNEYQVNNGKINNFLDLEYDCTAQKGYMTYTTPPNISKAQEIVNRVYRQYKWNGANGERYTSCKAKELGKYDCTEQAAIAIEEIRVTGYIAGDNQLFYLDMSFPDRPELGHTAPIVNYNGVIYLLDGYDKKTYTWPEFCKLYTDKGKQKPKIDRIYNMFE